MIHYIITFKVVKKQENRKTEKTGSKTCAKYAVNCVNKEMGVGELPCVYVRSTQEGHTHTQGHTTLEALAVFRRGKWRDGRQRIFTVDP